MRRVASAAFLGLCLAGCGSGVDKTAGTTPGAASTEASASWARFTLDCVSDAGFEADIEVSLGESYVRARVSEDRASLYQEVATACEEEAVALGLSAAGPPDEDQLRKRYEYLLSASACLTGLGYEPGEPPSVEVFVDSGGTWSPHAVVVATGNRAEIESAFQKCPQ